ncbi:hypothetical protein DSO57_1033150 [Entomophthora muscae]|uniref:Uncharacterized protein n=1 Tax=Entomophthora muscae TaxID=34485 RepID=A0ACC2SD40_9FUNG|nr:hypothetical protein DSO57_1033150 [Entomophthora muscae]
MTPPLTLQPNCQMEPTTAAETTSDQLFGVLYITLTGLANFMVPNFGSWSLLGQSLSYIIKLSPILWRALPLAQQYPHPDPTNASPYAWLLDRLPQSTIDNGGVAQDFVGPSSSFLS